MAFWDEVQRRIVGAARREKHAAAVRFAAAGDRDGRLGTSSVEGYTPPPNQGTPGDWQVVTPGYFETLRLSLREGRAFTAGDA